MTSIRILLSLCGHIHPIFKILQCTPVILATTTAHIYGAYAYTQRNAQQLFHPIFNVRDERICRLSREKHQEC